jgi:hypothetical protein
MRSSWDWMRSSRLIRTTDWKCQNRKSPGFDPIILWHSGIWWTENEAVFNDVNENKIKFVMKLLFLPYLLLSISSSARDSLSGSSTFTSTLSSKLVNWKKLNLCQKYTWQGLRYQHLSKSRKVNNISYKGTNTFCVCWKKWQASQVVLFYYFLVSVYTYVLYKNFNTTQGTIWKNLTISCIKLIIKSS